MITKLVVEERGHFSSEALVHFLQEPREEEGVLERQVPVAQLKQPGKIAGDAALLHLREESHLLGVDNEALGRAPCHQVGDFGDLAVPETGIGIDEM